MKIIQKEFSLKPRARGFHIITDEVLSHIPELKQISTGLAHVFIKHTSASLSINENADPSVRTDMETHFNVMVPEDAEYYEHTLEGPDDMTSHIKTTLIGTGVTIPITGGRLNLGTWQGIYLCEHRNRGGSRKIV
ncbi:MAG: secondary thiamine-phosphate synthase enzyme YjbQ, partial [Chlorobi bacterium]|nr:secondary thiamine-phosphate synthase enzyme YjbQ [Chlorobiota bacterium]